jgi:hypothetical protein
MSMIIMEHKMQLNNLTYKNLKIEYLKFYGFENEYI